jgi:hypothetical protein
MRKTRTVVLLLTCSTLVLASTLTPVGVATAASPASFTTERPFAGGNQWEPTVAADPASGHVYMLSTQIGGNCKTCAFWSIVMRVSSDGGSTFGPVSYLCGAGCAPGAGDWQADPAIKVATDGVLYVTYLNKFNPGATLQKSLDHGSTWTAPVAVAAKSAKSNDKPWLAISPRGKDVYVAFNGGGSSGNKGIGGASYVASSHDYGTTFAPAVLTSSDKLAWFAWSGVVAPDGSVYFAEDAEDLTTKGAKLALVYSTNRGRTWKTRIMAHSQAPPTCIATNCPVDQYSQSAAIAVDGSGELLYVYTKNGLAGAPKRLYATHSADGANWSAPTVVNAQGDSTFPVIAAATGSGDFRLAWQDDRNGGLNAWNTYFSSTNNDGGSWSPQTRLSDLGTGATYKSPNGYGFPYGDYMGLAVTVAGKNVVIWGEGEGWQTTGGTWFATGA